MYMGTFWVSWHCPVWGCKQYEEVAGEGHRENKLTHDILVLEKKRASREKQDEEFFEKLIRTFLNFNLFILVRLFYQVLNDFRNGVFLNSPYKQKHQYVYILKAVFS